MSLQSALLGYLISKAFFSSNSPLTPQENVVLQTTAVATGTLPLAAGFVGIIPALSMLNQEEDGADPIRITWISGAAWSLGVAFFGFVISLHRILRSADSSSMKRILSTPSEETSREYSLALVLYSFDSSWSLHSR